MSNVGHNSTKFAKKFAKHLSRTVLVVNWGTLFTIGGVPPGWGSVGVDFKNPLTSVVTSQERNTTKKAPRYFLRSSEANRHAPCRWWLFTDSNRGPVDYDSIALTD